MTLGLIPRALSLSFILVSCMSFIIGSLLVGRDHGMVLCDVALLAGAQCRWCQWRRRQSLLACLPFLELLVVGLRGEAERNWFEISPRSLLMTSYSVTVHQQREWTSFPTHLPSQQRVYFYFLAMTDVYGDGDGSLLVRNEYPISGYFYLNYIWYCASANTGEKPASMDTGSCTVGMGNDETA